MQTVLCNFVKVTGTVNGEVVSIARGIWKGQEFVDSPGCASYSSISLDTKWKSSQAMSILASFTAILATWPLVCACGRQLTMSTVLNIGSNCTWSCLWSGLTLLMLRSNACQAADLTDPKCELDTGAKCAIAATVLFFMASMAISCSIAVATVVKVAEAEQEKQAAAEKDEEQGK